MVDDMILRAHLEASAATLAGAEFGRTTSAERPPGGVAITIKGLTKSFGDLSVLRGIDLHVPPGQFLTIVGRSGCGKSTLLRILAGLDQPSGGTLLFDGRSSRDTSPVARLMFQEPRLLPWSNVLRNVEVGLGGQRNTPAGTSRVRASLEAVGLHSRALDWPSVLSGGQKQRVALARALSSSPNFLALDEPLGALDALTRIEMQGLLERVWQEQGFTAVLVTHDVSEALMLGDRVLLIEDGLVKLDLDVNMPRPRRRGSPEIAALEGEILRYLLQATI